MEHVEEVWRTALQRAGVAHPTTSITTKEAETHVEGSVEISASLPLIASTSGTGEAGFTNTNSDEEERKLVQADSYLPLLASHLRENKKRLILEDFHYLPDEVRKSVAFGLKALYEENAYAVIIGIWSEQNLLTYYNGDLTGRIEEINLTWDEQELSQVLSQGEGALNIEIAPGLKQQMIEASFQNVGLLQRLAEKICIEAGVLSSQTTKKTISDIEFLKKAIEQLVSDIRQRYINIAEVFEASMRSDAVLMLYARIYNELIDAANEELTKGMPYSISSKG